MALYSDPVAKLLKLGEIDTFTKRRNYAELGIGPDDIPELIRMATDKDLNFFATTTQGAWAPAHAWRALAQLHAGAASEPLVAMLANLEEDDWLWEEVPDLMNMLGPAAVPHLAAFLIDATHNLEARTAVSMCLWRIGRKYEASRAECVQALAAQLKKTGKADRELNGSIVIDLVDLNAVETAPLIERAFAAGRVDESICGDWETVQAELGLKKVPKYDGKKKNSG